MSLSKRLCNLIGPWLCRRLLWWVDERRRTREATGRVVADTERERACIARRLNLIDLSIRTHRPLAELEKIGDGLR